MASEFRPPFNWRDYLKVHPAADLFPLISEAELKELAEDIRKNGLQQAIVIWRDTNTSPFKDYLIDGRNRLDAAALAGLLSIDADGDFLIGDRSIIWNTITTDDPYEAVISLNIYRRHLTPDYRKRLVDDVLKAKPNLSNRQIGKLTRLDHHKVADRRRKLESTGEVSPVEKRIGADGKARKRSAKRKTDEAALREGLHSASESADRNGSRLTPAPTGCDVDAASPEGSAEQRAHAAPAPEQTAEPQASNAANKRILKSKITKAELLRMLEPILDLASKDDVATISDGDAALYDALEFAKWVIDYLQTAIDNDSSEADQDEDELSPEEFGKGLLVDLARNAAEKTTIALRNIKGVKFASGDKAKMVEEINLLIKKWEMAKPRIGVKEAKDKETAKFARGATP
jgi:ParB-like chromosome segregation protein Spo0J